MKIKHLLMLGLVAAFSSCSTAYRTGQTPDDVYYSPAPQENTYVTKATDEDKNSYSYRNQEDADIRRGIEDPVYRSGITFSMGMGNYSPYSIFPYSPYSNPFYNPYGYNYYGYDPFTPYAYNPYGFKGGVFNRYQSFIYNDMTFYSPYSYGLSPYYAYGLSPYYNPYFPILYSTGDLRVNTNTGARKYNLNVYNNNTGNNRTGTNVQPIRSTGTGTTQPSTGTGVGNVIRRVFTPSQRSTYTPPSNNNYNNNRRTYNDNYYNSNNNSYNTPQRTFTPSAPSNSSSSSSGSSNSAPVRTFRR